MKISPKRVNFIGIQNRHVVACDSYQQALVRTGYEQIIPYRVGSMFAVMAKKPGKVVGRTPTGIIVEYEDGIQEGVVLGRRFGNASGLTIPHDIASPLKLGDTFAVGAPIAYNTGFFEPDVLNKQNIIWKTAMLVETVFLESADTLEDSSAISRRLSNRLVTRSTKVKDIVVNFEQEIYRTVKEGEAVKPESILCTIRDAINATNDALDDDTLDTLRLLGAQTPQAKVVGKVDRLEVYYNGELEDMSDSLRMLVMESDKRMRSRSISVGKKLISGSVKDNFRIGNDPLLLDTACIRIHLTANVEAGVGD